MAVIDIRTKHRNEKTMVATLVGLAMLTGCERSDNSNSVNIPPSQAEAFNSPYTIFFEGMGEGSIVGKDVTFSLSPASVVETLAITGAEKIDGVSAQNTVATSPANFKTSNGSFIVSRTSESSIDEIALELVVKVDGYFTTGQAIIIPAEADITDEGAGFNVLSLTPLVPETEEVAVTATEVKAATSDTGVVQQPLVIETPLPAEGSANEQAIAGGTAKLDVPANTTLTDRNGDPVTGNITANVVYFSNEPSGVSDLSTDSALLSFPGGLSPTEILDESGEVDPDLSGGTFVSAGFTAIEIRNDKGQVVSNFEPPIDLTFQVSAKTINPETGEVVAKGETIPVWSYDEEAGQWKDEGTAVVGDYNAETDTFTVTKQISHLSYYNLDYWLGRNCRASFTIEGARQTIINLQYCLSAMVVVGVSAEQ